MRIPFLKTLSLGVVSSAFVSAQSPVVAPVPTTKILAIGHIVSAPDRDVIRQIMQSEVKDTVTLYLAGRLDQWFVRQDTNGVVFLLNASSVSEANEMLAKLPLVHAKQMEFELIPLGPLSPLRYLMGGTTSATKQ
jgi:hypothetical protein